MSGMGKGLVAIVALAAAGWTGGWFYVKGKVPDVLAAQVAALKAKGYEVKHDPVKISGFPFAHQVRLENIVVVGKRQEMGQPIELKAQIPWLEAAFSMMRPTTGAITGISDAGVELNMAGRAYAGTVKPVKLRGEFGGGGDSATYDLAADSLAYDMKAQGEAAKSEGLTAVTGEAGGMTAKGSYLVKTGKSETAFSMASMKASLTDLAPALGEAADKLQATTLRIDANAPMSGVLTQEGAKRRAEMTLPAQMAVAAKSGDAPESVLPLRFEKVKLISTQDDKRADIDLSGDEMMYGVEQKEGDAVFKMDARIQKFAVKGGADIAFFMEEMTPDKLSGAVPPDLTKANIEYQGTAGSSSVRAELKGATPEDGFVMIMDSGPSDGGVKISGGRIEGGGKGEGLKISFVGPQKFEGEVGKMAGKLSIPFGKKEGPQPFGIDYGFEAIKLSDQIWAMIDPTKALDRSLNKLRVAASGDVTIKAGLTEMAAAGQGGMTEIPNPPFVPGALKIDDVTIDALGLVAKATGAFKVDPENIEAPPAGEATISLKGWEKTVESFVTAGVLPPEQAMMAQGFIGMMGKDGAEGEKLFQIKISPEEGLSVNDMPLGGLPGMGGDPGMEEAPIEEEALPPDEADAPLPDDAEAPKPPKGSVRSLNPPQ